VTPAESNLRTENTQTNEATEYVRLKMNGANATTLRISKQTDMHLDMFVTHSHGSMSTYIEEVTTE
jgi:hypothetical protein